MTKINRYGLTRAQMIERATEFIRERNPTYDPETNTLECATHGRVHVPNRINFSLTRYTCPQCSPRFGYRPMDDAELLEKMTAAHDGRYTYELFTHIRGQRETKERRARATCLSCGNVFEVTPWRHVKGEQPCRQCVGYKPRGRSISRQRETPL